LQGLFFAPTDLPQYGMNVTTLLVPLFAIHFLTKRIVPPNQADVDLKYSQVLKLSAIYQGGIVVWVALGAFYGRGIIKESLGAVARFGGAYLLVILVDLIILYRRRHSCAKWQKNSLTVHLDQA
jgi:hypothetical protein